MCRNAYCLPKDYDKHALPMKGTKSMEINIGFAYLEILEINEKDFSITFRTVLYGQWEEPRLIPPDYALNDETNRVLDTSLLNGLWIMNLFIYNLKEVRKFKTLTPGDDSLGSLDMKIFIKAFIKL